MWDLFLSAASGSLTSASSVLIIDWTIRFISILLLYFSHEGMGLSNNV